MTSKYGLVLGLALRLVLGLDLSPWPWTSKIETRKLTNQGQGAAFHTYLPRP